MQSKAWKVLLRLLIAATLGCRSVSPSVPPSALPAPDSLQQQTQEQAQAGSQGTSYPGDAMKYPGDAIEPVGFFKPEALPNPSLPERSETAALALADLRQIALEKHPTLVAAAARIDAARGRQVQAGLYPNPVAGYHATEIGNVGTAGQQGAFISQRFITGGKLRLDQAIVQQEIDAARFRLRAQEQRVLSDVQMRFYQALVAQRRVELTQQLVSIAEELASATEKLLKGRLRTENDLLQAQIRADESRILLDNARNQHLEAWRRLSAVIALPSLPLAPLAGQLDSDLPNIEWASCQAMVLDSNPALHAARAQAAQARVAIERARREPIPNADLSVSVRHHNVTQSDVANVQLGLPLPLFDRNQGNRWAAEADLVAASNEIERIELSLRDRLAVVYRRYANALQQAERYRQQMIPRAEQSLQLVRDGYEKGQVEYLTLLTAQQTYLRVNFSYLDSLQELWTAAAEIEGQLLTGSLTARQ